MIFRGTRFYKKKLKHTSRKFLDIFQMVGTKKEKVKTRFEK